MVELEAITQQILTKANGIHRVKNFGFKDVSGVPGMFPILVVIPEEQVG